MVVCVYLLGTAPVAMDTQDHDVKRVRIRNVGCLGSKFSVSIRD